MSSDSYPHFSKKLREVCHQKEETPRKKSDKMDPTTMFPEEVWSLTLEKLSPRDVHKCGQVCTTFRNLLDSKKDSNLFTLVFPFLEHRKYISFNDALSCRLVCRHWRRIIEDHWQSMDFYLDRERKVSQPELINYFDKMIDVEEFHDRFHEYPSHLNPFISRDVRITNFFGLAGDAGAIMARRIWDGIGSILEKFGRHVWFCKIHIIHPFPLPELYERVLHRFLGYMPNLRALIVGVRSERFYNLPEPEWQAELALTRQVILQQPLPSLPRLFRMELENLPRELCHELLNLEKQSNSFQQFALQNFKAFPRGGCDNAEIASRFPKLEKMSLQCLRNTAALSDFQNVSWPLRRLNLFVSLGPDLAAEAITIRNLFQTLDHFGETLREMILDLAGDVYYDGTGANKDLRLNLTLLENLKVTLYSPLLIMDSVDFAAELKELRVFHFLRPEGFISTPNPEHVIQVCGIPDMNQSNIWSVLPKLKEFSLCEGADREVYCRPRSQIVVK